MNISSSDGLNIHEQRSCLNKLDEEIEKTIRELDSLNSQTLYQAKIIQKKITNNKFLSPNRSFSLNAKGSPNASFTDSLDYRDMNNVAKMNKEGHLQLSPGDLIPRDDPLKELGYGSADDNLQNLSKDDQINQEETYQRSGDSITSHFQIYDSKKSKDLNIIRTSSPPRKKFCEMGSNQKDLGSSFANKELSLLNQSNSRNLLPNMMEYHKFSNLDLPKEKIIGNAKPEHFFGHQLNLRRQSTQQSQSEKSSTLSYNVVDRLLQYGKRKEERLKALMQGKDVYNKKMTPTSKYKKNKLGSSYVISTENQDISFESEGKQSPSLNILKTINQNLPEDFQKPSMSNFNMLGKRNSLGSIEPEKIQIKKTILQQSETKAGMLPQKTKNDLFYELYKEGYGTIPETNDDNGGQTKTSETSGSQSTPNYMKNMNRKNKYSENELPKDLLEPKDQGKPSINTSLKYNNVESRYLNVTRDTSKSPQTKVGAEVKPTFRPQLSKKSLEIASKLESSFQRLIDTSITKNQEKKKKLLKEIENQHTFKPTINKLSVKLDERFKLNMFNGDELNRWDQLNLMKEKYKMEREIKRREKEELEAENKECTFHPQLNPNSFRVFRDTSTDFAERATSWKENREKRLNKEREYRLDKEMENCTFHPETHEFPSRLGNSYSGMNLSDISNMSIRGLDQHFEKIDKANRMKKELEAKQEKYTGKTWKSKITVPKEFHFHKREAPQGLYQRTNSHSRLNISSTEEKIQRNVLFLDRGKTISPQGRKNLESYNDTLPHQMNDYSINGDNFGEAVVRLHYELQRMQL